MRCAVAVTVGAWVLGLGLLGPVRAGDPPAAPGQGTAPVGSMALPFPLVARFETVGVPEGLPSWKVSCVLAAEGKVWAGTDRGLAVREGKDGAWRTVGTKEGLPHRMVSSLALDPATGDLWVGTFKGLARFTAGRIDSFTQVGSGLPSDVVYAVLVVEDAVWVATAAGTGRYDKKTGAWSLYDHQNSIMHEPWCYSLARAPGRILIGVWGGGIVEHDPVAATWKEYRDPDHEMELDLIPDDGPIHDVTSSVAWSEGVLWQGTYFGLSRQEAGRWRTFVAGKSPLVSGFVNTLAVRGRTAWLATDQGLQATDGDSWAAYRRAGDGTGRVAIHRPGQPPETRTMATALPHEFVLGLSVGEAEVWVATEHGLARGVFAPPALEGRR